MYKQNTCLHTCPFQNQLALVPKPAPPRLPSHLSGSAAGVHCFQRFCLPKPKPWLLSRLISAAEPFLRPLLAPLQTERLILEQNA